MRRNLKYYIIIMLKGLAMGAADVVPGVSGGTIAFVSGIYEELIFSIRSINIKSLKLLFNGKFILFSRLVNFPFLLSIVIGIFISIISLAKVMNYLLKNYEVLTWAFFFGLIISSAYLISKKITRWGINTIIAMLLGIVLASFITFMTPASTPDSLWFIFLCGIIAICAMILPGISGAFLLIMLGKYVYMIDALSSLNISVLFVFLGGAIIGIISFSNVLGYFLKKYHNPTIALLIGFLIGSLNKVWPWKQVIDTFVSRNGDIRPLIEENILPSTYANISGVNNYLLEALLCASVGFSLIFIIERIADKAKK